MNFRTFEFELINKSEGELTRNTVPLGQPWSGPTKRAGHPRAETIEAPDLWLETQGRRRLAGFGSLASWGGYFGTRKGEELTMGGCPRWRGRAGGALPVPAQWSGRSRGLSCFRAAPAWHGACRHDTQRRWSRGTAMDESLAQYGAMVQLRRGASADRADV
jgi:hypothetical protein